MNQIDLRDPVRKASILGPYLELDFPESFRVEILTDSGSWNGLGDFSASQVRWGANNSRVAESDEVSILICCIADHGDFFVQVNELGSGVIQYLRIVPLPLRIFRPRMPDLDAGKSIRKASVVGPYLELDFPASFRIATLEPDGTWTERGPFRSDQVDAGPDNRYAMRSEEGVHFVLCIADHGDYFVHVSSGGVGVIRYCRLIDLTSTH